MAIPTGEMVWGRPKPWKLDWELRQGSKVVAKMSSPSMFGTTVRASIGDEHYVNRKGGLRRPGAAIARQGEPNDIGRLEFDSLDRGTVLLADGATYRWERQGPAGTWAMLRDDGDVLFTVHRNARDKYPVGRVKVMAADRSMGVLLILSWFVINSTEC
jgi:hypothetical protein